MGNYQNKNSESAKIRNLAPPAATRATPKAHQLRTVLPLIHARCDGIVVVLVQAVSFYYSKYGIHEYMSVAHCPQPELRFDYACVVAYAKVQYYSVCIGAYLFINGIRV